MTRESRNAIAVGFPQNGDEGGYFMRVGQPFMQPDLDGRGYHDAGKITRITVTDDLPALHCYMERVRVFVGDKLACEAPLHAIEIIEYDIT